jgi:hypothetical protein
MFGLRRMRPRFTFAVSGTPTQAMKRLRARLEAPDAPCIGRVYAEHKHALLKIHPSDQHLWSPQLSLDFEAQRGGGTLVRGLLGPHPSVWTLFMCAYAVLAFVGFGIGMYGYAVWSLGQPGLWTLWLLPGMGVLAGLVYALSLLGQHWGYAQMVVLRRAVTDALDAEPLDPDAASDRAEVPAETAVA